MTHVVSDDQIIKIWYRSVAKILYKLIKMAIVFQIDGDCTIEMRLLLFFVLAFGAWCHAEVEFRTAKRNFHIIEIEYYIRSWPKTLFSLHIQHDHCSVTALADISIFKCKIHLSCPLDVSTEFNRWIWTFVKYVSISRPLCINRLRRPVMVMERKFPGVNTINSWLTDLNYVETLEINMVWHDSPYWLLWSNR